MSPDRVESHILNLAADLEITNTIIILRGESPEHVMRIDCHNCRYYFVTWNQQFPHGCRAMGFKSWRYPIDEVRSASNGADCLLYQPKRNRDKKDL